MRNSELSDNENAHDSEHAHDNENAHDNDNEPLTKKQKAARTREANRAAARRKEEEIMAETKGECSLVTTLSVLTSLTVKRAAMSKALENASKPFVRNFSIFLSTFL